MAFTVTFTASSSDNYSERFDFYFMNSEKTMVFMLLCFLFQFLWKNVYSECEINTRNKSFFAFCSLGNFLLLLL